MGLALVGKVGDREIWGVHLTSRCLQLCWELWTHYTQHAAASGDWRGAGGTDVAGESSLEQPNRVLLIHRTVLESNEYLDMIFEQIKEA